VGVPRILDGVLSDGDGRRGEGVGFPFQGRKTVEDGGGTVVKGKDGMGRPNPHEKQTPTDREDRADFGMEEDQAQDTYNTSEDVPKEMGGSDDMPVGDKKKKNKIPRKSKLTDEERKEIIDGVLAGTHTQTYYAEKYNVSKPYVSQLLKTVKYPGLKGPVKPRTKKLPRCEAEHVSYEECLGVLPVAILYCELQGLGKEMDMLEKALRNIMRAHTKKKMKVPAP